MGVIAIEGIEIYGYHGVYSIEREQGNLYVVDLYMDVAIVQAGESDELEDTLDYFQVYQSVVKILEKPVNLLEHIVGKIGNHIMKNYPTVNQVRVKVSKMSPIAMKSCRNTYVERVFEKQAL